MNIAIIPARGGSKRIRKKNIKFFFGKPMISYSIEVAKKSKLFDRIIISTDDSETIDIAKKCGAEIPFIRPNELSGDHVGTNDVMEHAVKFIMSDRPNLTAVCCIYPTVPLLMKEDLIKGFQLFNSGKWQFVFSATKYSYSVFRSFTKNEKGSLKMLYPQHWNSNSQDLEEVMHDAGQFYWGSPKAWLNKELRYNDHTTVIELPNWRVQDINTLEDWHQAEKKYEILNK